MHTTGTAGGYDYNRELACKNHHVFQKVWDEIKYLVKIATAGSKEARELEKVKKAFEDAYRESTAKNTAEGGVKYALEMDMTETERYNELKDKTLYVVESTDQSQYQTRLDNIEALPPKAKSKVEKEIYALAEELGILRKPMTTPEIKFDFQISKNNGLKKSLNNQLDYGGSYGDFARALINLDKIIPNAVLIDAYTKDRYADTSRANNRFEGGYVLLGAFQDSENIIPVKLTIKKETGETGNLYVVVAMTKIKRTSVLGSEGTTPDGAEQPLPDTGSTFSLQQIIANVNAADADFLKYIPDGFLSEEQVKAKQKALDEQNAKTARYSLGENSLSNKGDIAPAYGNYNVYGRDIALGSDDFAPIATQNIGTGFSAAPGSDDFAPMAENVTPAYELPPEDVALDDIGPVAGFTGSYSGTTYSAKQAELLAGLSTEALQNGEELAGRQDITFSHIGLGGKSQIQQEWVDAGLVYEETDANGNTYYAVSEGAILDERARRANAKKHARMGPVEDIAPIREDVGTIAEDELAPVREDYAGAGRRLTSSDLANYMRIGDRKHVRDGKQKILAEGDSPILTKPSEIVAFIRNALYGKAKDVIKAYGRVNHKLASAVSNATNGAVNIDDYYLELDANRIAHMQDHVEQDKDVRNIPLTEAQIEQIPSYLDDFDDLINVIRRKDGSIRLMLGKKINGHTIIVETVSKGRKALHPVTAYQIDTSDYIKKYKTRAIDRSSTSRSENSDTVDISRPAIAPVGISIPKQEAVVNPDDSTGAAPSGFDPVSHLQYEYGSLPEGEHPIREDSLPKSVTGKDKVSLTARTVKGAEATPDELVDLLDKKTVGGRFSYK